MGKHGFVDFFCHCCDASQPPPDQPARLVSYPPMQNNNALGNARIAKPTTPPKALVQPSPSQAVPASPSSSVATIDSHLSTGLTKKNEALKKAIEEHINNLPEHDRQRFREASKTLDMSNQMDDLVTLNKTREERSAMARNAQRAENVLQFLNRFMGGVAIGIQANPEISAIVVGGLRVVFDCALRFFAYYTKLIDMVEELTDYVRPLESWFANAAQYPDIISSGAKVIVKLLQFCLEARRIFVDDNGLPNGKGRLFLQSQWNPFHEKFGKIREEISHSTRVLKLTTQGVQLDVVIRDNKRLVLDWFNAPKFEHRHKEVLSQKHPKTADWLLGTDQFKAWLGDQDSSLLWCHGKPGVGKSVIASNVIDYLSGQYPKQNNIGILYVYYDYRNEHLKDLGLVISGIMFQLCQKCTTMIPKLNTFRDECRDPLVECTLDLYYEVARNFKKIFLIVDALDECPVKDRDKIIGFLFKAMDIPHTKILVTSRKEIDIELAFSGSGVRTIGIREQDSAGDIKTFVTDKVKELKDGKNGKRLRLPDDSLEEEIIRSLIDKSEGMILWANLQLQELCELSKTGTALEMRRALLELPQGLDETYIRMMNQIAQLKPYRQTVAVNAFMWVLYAKIPLSAIQLPCAVSISDMKSGDETVSIEAILENCRGLIVINENRRNYPAQLLHYSIKEFLTRVEKDSVYWAQLKSDTEANNTLAISCIRYLQHAPLREGPRKSVRELRQLLYDYPFIHYAAENFDKHVKDSLSGSLTKECVDGIDVIFQNRKTVAAILQLKAMHGNPQSEDHKSATQSPILEADPKLAVYASNLINVPPIFQKYATGPPPKDALHRVVANGESKLAARLINDGWQVDKPDDSGVYPIYHACSSGDESTVSLLLKHKAPVNVACGALGSPLQAAAAHGYEQIVRMLLREGAQNIISNPKGEYTSAFEAAVHRGHANVVKLLLGQGVDVESRGKSSRNLLELASSRGHYDVVQLLVDHGADVNPQDSSHISALESACGSSILSSAYNMANLLIERRADLKSQGPKALKSAVESRHYEVAKLLLDHGVAANTPGEKNGTALGIASRCGMEDIVVLLIENGADVNFQDDNENTAIHEAAFSGEENIVKLLIENGADVNAGRGRFGTALQAASLFGYEGIVKLLLDNGADVNCQDEDRAPEQNSALQHASFQGHNKIVKLLLEKRPDIDAMGSRGSALEAAYTAGHHDIVDLLLAKGALDVRSLCERN
ncbi:hypothetical protein FQN50_009719 [Emmonsiellopsis sp. PD_5]|nr:hypothetical protein FQN50_009719 [Emmonsiellopsis sp. PD_5]